MSWDEWVPFCDCGHDKETHRRGGSGRCAGLDSYSVACECPSYECADDDERDEEAVVDLLTSEHHRKLAALAAEEEDH
ncbi:hypothetical protein [Nocardia farcinica]|uniref:hypothetical protein n=1 Tax=Nocardia farcinica TaxID=37329 RepID=UPI002453EEBE|nr:hypothetical protein [Nocardia farcinica]